MRTKLFKSNSDEIFLFLWKKNNETNEGSAKDLWSIYEFESPG